MIEDLHPEVGHANFIYVGKGKGHLHRGLPVDRVEFAVYVSAGFLKMCIIHRIKDNTLKDALATKAARCSGRAVREQDGQSRPKA